MPLTPSSRDAPLNFHLILGRDGRDVDLRIDVRRHAQNLEYPEEHDEHGQDDEGVRTSKCELDDPHALPSARGMPADSEPFQAAFTRGSRAECGFRTSDARNSQLDWAAETARN